MGTLKMGATYCAKALVPMHQSARNHISEQINKKQKCKGQYKIQIVWIMNEARSCWRMVAGVARSPMFRDSRWRKWWRDLKQKNRRAKTNQDSPILLHDVRKWISWRGIEKLGNAHKILFLTTNEIIYLIFILTLKLEKLRVLRLS